MAKGGGIAELLSKETAGLPVWVWGLVVVAGIAAAYVVPKISGGKAAQDTTGQESTPGTGSPSGIGLATDPTSGLPYAVEGLVPGGGMAGSGGLSSSPIAGGGTLPSVPTTQTSTSKDKGKSQQQKKTTATTTKAYDPFTPIQDKPIPANAQYYTVNGKEYTIVRGGAGRVWGVPGHKTLKQAQDAPVGPGTKVLLYRPDWPGNTVQKRIG